MFLKYFSYRHLHGCKPLIFSPKLAQSAQKYAEELAASNTFKHSTGLPVGENLAKRNSSGVADLSSEFKFEKKAIDKSHI